MQFGSASPNTVKQAFSRLNHYLGRGTQPSAPLSEIRSWLDPSATQDQYLLDVIGLYDTPSV